MWSTELSVRLRFYGPLADGIAHTLESIGPAGLGQDEERRAVGLEGAQKCGFIWGQLLQA